MKEEGDGWTERRERRTKGRQQNARRRRWRIIKGVRESRITVINTASPLHHDLERSIAGRMTEERWRERVRARDQHVRTTERWKRDTCERQKEGEIEIQVSFGI